MITEKALVLYKTRPALITGAGDKLEITLPGGEKMKVREKDVLLLHPGPGAKIDEIDSAAPEGDVAGAWELLAGTTVPLAELAELAYGSFTPPHAWAAWRLVQDGLYFSGTPSAVMAKDAAAVAAEQAKRSEKQQEGAERAAFLQRLASGNIELPADSRQMQDVEALALGKTEKSKTMKEAGKQETPLEAHKLLVATGYWPPEYNPYPARFGRLPAAAKQVVPAPPAEDRLDLSHLPAYAIDNEGSTDPDDAISLDGQTVWVHVADPAASITPDSPCDKEARAFGETLYLPEATYRMLGEDAVPLFALGLKELCPALSFKITVDEAGAIQAVDILKTLVRVQRLTYQEADQQSASPALAPLFNLADKLYQKRLAAGAVVIDMPEVNIRVTNGEVTITAAQTTRSALVVRECMLLAGEAAARWAIRQRLPFPFVAQEAGDLPANPLPGYAGSYQKRRCMRPRQLSSQPGAHAGLGLGLYTQVTSPLRRYTDLICHQQIRAFLAGQPVKSSEDILAQIAAGEAAAHASVLSERESRKHWTHVYLASRKDSLWEAVVLDKKGNRATVVIPALAMETTVALKNEAELNDSISIKLGSVKIPELEAHFFCE